MTTILAALAALATAQEEDSWFPLRPGTSWCYTNGIEFRVRDSERADRVILEISGPGGTTQLWMSSSSDGIRIHRAGDRTIDPPMIFLELPVRRAQPRETVRVAGRSYECLRIDIENEQYWLARGVGVVRFAWSGGANRTVCELRSMSPARKFRILEKGTGRVLIASYAGSGATATLRRALEDLRHHAKTDLDVKGAFADRTDTEAQAMVFAGKHEAILFVEGGRATIFWDRRGDLVESLPGLVALLPEPVVWEPVRFAGGALRLPRGWRVTNADSQGSVEAVGPHGQVNFGQAAFVVTPAVARTCYTRPPYVAEYGDPAAAAEVLVPQFNQSLRLQGLETVTWIRLHEQAPVAYDRGVARLLLSEIEYKGGRWLTLSLCAQLPNGDGTYTWYQSSVGAPKDSFEASLPVLLEIWANYRVDDRVFLERLRSAMRSMSECSRIVREAVLEKSKAVDRGHRKWCKYIRGYSTWKDGKGDTYDIPNGIDPAQLDPTGGWKPVHP
jgi:hypothetical protein